MRHRMTQRKLGRPTDHRLALIRNLITDLVRYEKLRTTQPKAEELQREAEKLITVARRGTLYARRQVSAVLYDEAVAAKLMSDVAPRFQGRSGGYTRVVKLGPRKGDGAPMAQIELVQ
jgi:large subunit ribosomal protein L17